METLVMRNQSNFSKSYKFLIKQNRKLGKNKIKKIDNWILPNKKKKNPP